VFPGKALAGHGIDQAVLGIFAVGASFGGYMINWIAGAWPIRAATLMSGSRILIQKSSGSGGCTSSARHA